MYYAEQVTLSQGLQKNINIYLVYVDQFHKFDQDSTPECHGLSRKSHKNKCSLLVTDDVGTTDLISFKYDA